MGQKINPLGFRLGTTQSHHSVWFEQPKNYSEGLQEDQKIRNCIKDFVREKSSGIEAIARIEIQKRIDLIRVRIYMGFPKLLFEIENESQAKEKEGRAKEKESRAKEKERKAKERKRKAKEKIMMVKEEESKAKEEERKAKEKEMMAKIIKELEMNVQKELNLNSIHRKLKITVIKIANPYEHPKIIAEFIAIQIRNRVSYRQAMRKAIELAERTKPKGIKIKIAGRLNGRDMARAEWIRKGRMPLQTIRAKIDYCSYAVRTIYGVLGIKIWIFVDEK